MVCYCKDLHFVLCSQLLGLEASWGSAKGVTAAAVSGSSGCVASPEQGRPWWNSTPPSPLWCSAVQTGIAVEPCWCSRHTAKGKMGFQMRLMSSLLLFFPCILQALTNTKGDVGNSMAHFLVCRFLCPPTHKKVHSEAKLSMHVSNLHIPLSFS